MDGTSADCYEHYQLSISIKRDCCCFLDGLSAMVSLKPYFTPCVIGIYKLWLL